MCRPLPFVGPGEDDLVKQTVEEPSPLGDREFRPRLEKVTAQEFICDDGLSPECGESIACFIYLPLTRLDALP